MMAGSQRLKYIAEGFLEDSTILLKEFVDLSTVEFSEFASLWKKHYFSLIFMGRPDQTETCEFVNEIFRISSQYLFSPSFYQQVGAVYLLYALFRNQISKPSVMIRIEMNHWRIIATLRKDSIFKKYKTLHYVIDFLVDNAFIYVANQTLKGPLIGNMPKTSKNDEKICNLKASYKSDLMKYSVDNNLTELRDLQMQYVTEKKVFGDSARLNLSESHLFYQEAIDDLQEIVNPSKKQKYNLGDRRAKLKAESFMRKSRNRFGKISDDEIADDPNYGSPIKKPVRTRKPRRRPKEERRVGRPRTKPKKEPPPEPKSDDEIDISHLLPQQQDFYLPPSNQDRKLRTKRDPYYQLSPRREDTDSDTDNQ